MDHFMASPDLPAPRSLFSRPPACPAIAQSPNGIGGGFPGPAPSAPGADTERYQDLHIMQTSRQKKWTAK